jgi:hypothetical protein
LDDEDAKSRDFDDKVLLPPTGVRAAATMCLCDANAAGLVGQLFVKDFNEGECKRERDRGGERQRRREEERGGTNMLAEDMLSS